MAPAPFLPLAAAAVALYVLSAAPASAQAATGLGSDTLGGAAPYGNPISDDRTYVHAFFDQLEERFGDGSYFRWDGQAWIGNDYNKIWLKSEGRYNADNKGKVSDGDQELLYSRPISTYFDIQAGVRYDLDSKPGRAWGAVGIQGLAIGFWNVAVTTYASDSGHFALRTNASYDLYITQRLVLQPQFETNWYTRGDRSRGIGSGPSDIDAGLRLRYEFTRKFAPYVGVSFQRFFAGTAALRRKEGSSLEDTRFLTGLRTWF